MKNKRLLLVCFVLLLANSLLLAQGGRTITGVVTGDDGRPVPAATVSIKGTTQSVITDDNGRYSITVPNNSAVLVFSSVGYGSRELTVGTASTLNMDLVSTATDLGEVVVTTALGIKRQQKSLG
ncbi:MAG TPA: carboxypeptidase-like regulatory domain-containing protein, partial [Chitinophagaceae bacterium]|nr:carboxypeptidase-like regulatory domain-containing protein [Chitinophagaceae bacterium]